MTTPHTNPDAFWTDLLDDLHQFLEAEHDAPGIGPRCPSLGLTSRLTFLDAVYSAQRPTWKTELSGINLTSRVPTKVPGRIND